MLDNTDDLMPIKELTEHLKADGFDVTLRQMMRYTEPARDIGFPEPGEQLGRFKFYDYNQVKRWLKLWQRATKNHTEGEDRLNGTR